MLHALLLLKLALDFLSAQRGLGFALCVLVGLTVVFAPSAAAGAGPVRRAGPGGLLLGGFVALTAAAYLQGGEADQAMKYLGLALLAGAVPVVLGARPEADRVRMASLLLQGNFLFASLCILRALASGGYAERDFPPFEHANLFGSYILSGLPLLFAVESRAGVRWRWRAMFIALAWASTSTGSGVLSLLLLVDFRRFGWRRVLRVAVLGVALVLAGEAVLAVLMPTLHTKIFSPFAFVADFGFQTLLTAVRIGYSLYDFGPSYESSLTWRIYAYAIFLSHAMTAPWPELLFGRGFQGHAAIWNGYMPHNDFILALIDFGAVGVGLMLAVIARVVAFVVRHRELAGLAPILVCRLMFENNIYSFYLMSSLIINACVLLAAYRGAR